MVNEADLERIAPLLRRALKTTVIGAIFYAAYFFLSPLLAQLSAYIPGFQQTIETFVTVYIILIIGAELTSGSILHHLFNAAQALFVIGFLMVSLKTGVLNLTFQGLSFAVDIHLLVIIAMLLSLLGLARSVLQTIDYMNEKVELSLR